MIETNELKVEIAQLRKKQNQLMQQREAVQAHLHGVIGAISQMEKLVKKSEEPVQKESDTEPDTTQETPTETQPEQSAVEQ
jgi:hypothetical protein